mgnify:FL=1
MLFHRATHHTDGRAKGFPPEADAIWSDTTAGLVGHMMDDRWMSFDEILTAVRAYEAENPTDGPVEVPPAQLADIVQGLSDLAAQFMVTAEDRAVLTAPAVTFTWSVPQGTYNIQLHPLAQAVLAQIGSDPMTIEDVRADLVRVYPEHDRPTIAETLKGLADLLRHGLVVGEEHTPEKAA